MAYFYPGYSKAREDVSQMELPQLLSLIDDLYGRKNLEDESDIEQVREEAFRQLREEWTDKTSAEYETAQFYSKVHRAMNHA